MGYPEAAEKVDRLKNSRVVGLFPAFAIIAKMLHLTAQDWSRSARTPCMRGIFFFFLLRHDHSKRQTIDESND